MEICGRADENKTQLEIAVLGRVSVVLIDLYGCPGECLDQVLAQMQLVCTRYLCCVPFVLFLFFLKWFGDIYTRGDIYSSSLEKT